MRGSSTLFDYGDSYLTMNPYKDSDNFARLTFELRNAPPVKPLIIIRDDNVLWCTVEAEAPHGTTKLTASDVINALKAEKGGEMMRQDLLQNLIERYKVSDSTVKRTVKEVEEMGLVQSVQTDGRGSPTKLVYRGNI